MCSTRAGCARRVLSSVLDTALDTRWLQRVSSAVHVQRSDALKWHAAAFAELLSRQTPRCRLSNVQTGHDRRDHGACIWNSEIAAWVGVHAESLTHAVERGGVSIGVG